MRRRLTFAPLSKSASRRSKGEVVAAHSRPQTCSNAAKGVKLSKLQPVCSMQPGRCQRDDEEKMWSVTETQESTATI